MALAIAERVRDAALRSPLPRTLWVKAIAVYLGLRFVTYLLMSQAAEQQDYYPGVTGPAEGGIDLALSWDAVWYERIVGDGYPDRLPVDQYGRVAENPWAFYPVYPYAVRAVMLLTRLDFATVAPLVALLAGVGAAVLMAQLFVETLPERPDHPGLAQNLALAAVAVWAACPVAPVLQMAYTESTGVLLLTAVLLLLVRERWWGVGALALLLGLARPIALPLVVVVAVGVWLRWRARTERSLEPRESAGMVFALGATGLSGLLWTTVAALRTDRIDAYPQTMSAWRGGETIAWFAPWRRTVDYAWTSHEGVFVWPAVGLAVPVVVSLVLLVPGVARGLDLRLRVWAAAYCLYLCAVGDGGTSVFRYLVPLFPLAAVLVGAHAAGRGEPRWWRVRTTFWVVAGIVGQVGWIWVLVRFVPMPAGGDYPP